MFTANSLFPRSCRPVLRCLTAAMLSVLAYGQTPTGQIRIEVKDPAGAATAASGTLSQVPSGVRRSFSADEQGTFTFENLPYGRYRLEVGGGAFATQAILLDVASTTPVSQAVTLALGVQTAHVDVVATTPLAGLEQMKNDIAAPVQTATQKDIEQSGAINFSDFLNRRLNGVYLNEVQGNPFQPDLNYRGYTASPLLGTPQGISVYMDGVRQNQPFGDVVSWDLIPRVAIAETTLMPGSNPLFGLNTLGGAVSLTTKDGYTNQGSAIQISGGSFGRKTAELEHGGSNKRGWSWYGATSLFFEDGWRQASQSNIRQFFGKLGWQGAKTTVNLTLGYANNQMNGNGLQEQSFLARDYSSVYTVPDVTGNHAPNLNFTVRHALTSKLTLTGNAYYRYVHTSSFNADLNDDSLDQSIYQTSAAERTALATLGYTNIPTSGANATNTPFPFLRCIGNVLRKDEPAEKCNGLLNRGNSWQQNYGVTGQLIASGSFHGNRNQFIVGAGFDGNRTTFRQSSELGYLNPDRSVTGVSAFGDGVTGGNVDGEPYDTRVDLNGRIRTSSVYVTDTLSVGNKWNLTGSGRYNRTTVINKDHITPGGGTGSLDGNYVFGRFNPAVGITYNPTGFLNTYFSYSEGSRAPTSVELGCADPVNPCKLPNAMAGDPPLKQVVTHTFEGGLRSGADSRIVWSLGWFRAENHDDLLFVQSPQTGFGYFKNFGKTRRQGLEIDLSRQIRRVTLGGGYTFLNATYQSPEIVSGSSNSTNLDALAGRKGIDGTIQINPGSQIPLVPSHMLKAYMDVQVTSKVTVNLGMAAFSSSYARGNENNTHVADGVYYLGPGKSGGYAVLNLSGRYQLTKRIQIFAQVSNLADRHFYTAATLGPMGFNPTTGTFLARPFAATSTGAFPIVHSTFLAPGAPRGAWGGAKFRF
ncbi:MAG: TonB-dependent receptor [Acidobacteriota bacterium]